MELPLETLNSFQPKTGTLAQWNAAYLRVEDYLRAHQIRNRLHQSRLIQRVLARAAQRHEADPALDPTTLAAEEVDKMMDEWFAELLGEKDVPHERIAIEGRVALWLSDAPRQWPYAFLEGKNTPGDFAKAMQQSSIQAGPDLAVSSMVPRPIDLGALPEMAGETLASMDRRPILRVAALWTLFLAAMMAVFYASR